MQFSSATTWQVRDDAGRRKYLNADERQRFMRAADELPRAAAAMCYVLVFTGCRITEALTLTRQQLDPQQATLAISTLKRRRRIYRLIPIPYEIVVMLESLPGGTDDPFFPWHRSTAWRYVKTAMSRAQIAGPMATCRGARHGYGIHAATSKVPPNLIQRFMGHASPVTTGIYIDAVGVEERAFAERMW